jgi:tRNA threonylcarbamoyladenosine biosynthesis protein TsaB
VIVLGIETSTPQTSVALGDDRRILGSVSFISPSRQDQIVPAIDRLLGWTGYPLDHVAGVAVGVGPGLFTGLRIGIQVGKSLAQVLHLPILGIPSLDSLAYGIRHTRRLICAVIDARRGEVFSGLYRAVPGGVMRTHDYLVGRPERLAAELQALDAEVLLAGDGAILYQQVLRQAGSRVEFASPARAHPESSSLVELAVPRFIREETARPAEVRPLYLRRTDAEIAWDQRARGVSA